MGGAAGPGGGRLLFLVLSMSLAGIVLLALALSPVWGQAMFGPSQSGTQGSYSLNSTDSSVELAFPTCAFVVVHWAVVTGAATNFSVWPPAMLLASNCHGPAPSNASLPPGRYVMDAPPACFESGRGGVCSFTATQSGYQALIGWNDSVGSRGVEGENVQFTVMVFDPPPTLG